MTPAAEPGPSGERDATSGFPFVGESLALDLVNTQIVVRGRPRDLLAAPADFAAWREAASASDPQHALSMRGLDLPEDETVLARVKAFRAALREIFDALVSGKSSADVDLAPLNHVLRAGYLAIETDANGQFHQVSGSHEAGPDAILLPIARSAMTLLTERDLSRLHRCANERCVLLFYDTTKSATRRWCSTGCMNRARSSRRYRERRAAELAADPGS